MTFAAFHLPAFHFPAKYRNVMFHDSSGTTLMSHSCSCKHQPTALRCFVFVCFSCMRLFRLTYDYLHLQTLCLVCVLCISASMWSFGRRVSKAKIAIFDDTTLSAQRTPANIHINFIWLETGIIWLHFCCWQCGSVFIQIFVVGSERRICNVTERIIAVQSQFKVIQGRWFCYQSKARMWLPVSDQ